jgi:FtsH-binding integral membrane protein
MPFFLGNGSPPMRAQIACPRRFEMTNRRLVIGRGVTTARSGTMLPPSSPFRFCEGGDSVTNQEAVNRGYNLMICAILFAAGCAFGSVLAAERDLNDMVDDAWLLITGILAVMWYLFAGSRLKRSPIPLGFAALAAVGQAVGVVLEASDKNALGDNIGGSILYGIVLVLAIYQYVREPRLESSRPPV